MADDDPDLPGDEEPLPATNTVEIIQTPGGPAWAEKVAVSEAEQLIMRHNQLRYAELEKLRRGMQNSYHQTRYRA